MEHPEHEQEWPPEPTGAAMRSEAKGCLSKVRYDSFEQACAAAERARMRYGAIQQAYFCEWCWGYHNTTVERRRF